MDLLYERIAQLVAVSAISKSGSIGNVQDKTLNRLRVQPQELTIKFSEYVKSQVHLNIVADLYDRSISEYAKTLSYLNGDVVYSEEAEKVLGYFYQDMANFLINNPDDVKLNLIVDAEFRSSEVVDLSVVKNSLLHVLNEAKEVSSLLSSKDGDNSFVIDKFIREQIDSFDYAIVINAIDNREEALDKIDNYTLAACLLKAKPGVKLVFSGGKNEITVK